MNYRQHLKKANTIVIKVGTSLLTYPNGKLNFFRIDKLTRVISTLRNQGKNIVLVSSGAIAVGSENLGLAKRPENLPDKQAAASIGQAILMRIYQKFFGEYNQRVGQILITKAVTDNPLTKKNAINTFNTLLNMGIIPIVNENDTIATDEIEFGDNDTLSATVATLIDADILILLSDIDGLYTDDPRKDPSAQIIHVVDSITEDIEKSASGAGTAFGTGGMITKILAAKICYKSNIDTVITNGKDPNIVYDILEGKEVGTLFLSKDQ